MGPARDPDRQRRREELLTRMVRAFSRGDHAALHEGVRPDVALTLGGSSWLAGKYRGLDEFGYYVAGAALVLGAADGQLSYLHTGTEMTVVHDFLVGGGPWEVRMALHEVITWDADDKIESLLVRPWDQALFDQAVDAFLAVPSPRTV